MCSYGNMSFSGIREEVVRLLKTALNAVNSRKARLELSESGFAAIQDLVIAIEGYRRTTYLWTCLPKVECEALRSAVAAAISKKCASLDPSDSTVSWIEKQLIFMLTLSLM